jgi:SulP family sulfate permease
VGYIAPGVNIIHIPSFKYNWSELFVDTLPLTFITFMESYSVANKLATMNKQLQFLNCNQELWAVGMANMLGSVGSAYPVAGSYSRSSLNGTAGAKTPLSAFITMIAILLTLGVATEAMFFIPNAALAAVIWVALYNIIAFSEWWEAYVSSFKDFFVMITTFTTVFVLDTSVGLAIGLGTSLMVFLFESILSSQNEPVSKQVGKKGLQIELIRLNNDLNFLTISRIKDFISFEVMMREEPLHALIIDFVDVKHIDLTCIKAFEEIKAECHELHVLFITTNVKPNIEKEMVKLGIFGDCDQIDVGIGCDEASSDSGHEFRDLRRGFSELQDIPMQVAAKINSHPDLQKHTSNLLPVIKDLPDDAAHDFQV